MVALILLLTCSFILGLGVACTVLGFMVKSSAFCIVVTFIGAVILSPIVFSDSSD